MLTQLGGHSQSVRFRDLQRHHIHIRRFYKSHHDLDVFEFMLPNEFDRALRAVKVMCFGDIPRPFSKAFQILRVLGVLKDYSHKRGIAGQNF